MHPPNRLQPHLTVEQLRQRYLACHHPQEKQRWHALYLIAGGARPVLAARKVGRSGAWVSLLVRRYNEGGIKAVPNRRRPVARGRKPCLDADCVQALKAALSGSAPDGKRWTAPKVVDWIRERTGVTVHQSTAWRWMQRFGFAAGARAQGLKVSSRTGPARPASGGGE
jgi:transposase